MVLIGHSHMGCILEAAERRKTELVACSLWLVAPVVHQAGEARLSDEVAQLLRGAVFSYVGGADHLVAGYHPHPRPFDFVLPEAPELPIDETAALIPSDQVLETLREIGAEHITTLRLMARAHPGQMVHIAPPPPLRHDLPMTHPLFVANAGQTEEVSPPYLRLKLWRLHCAMVGKVCLEEGVRFLLPPPSSVDSEGFLLPPYRGRPCHANVGYGELVLDQMQALAA